MFNAAIIARAGRAGFACLAGFALVILSASLAAADYGPRIILGNNYQQWSDVTSKGGSTLDPGPCTNTINCYVLFQPIPQNRPLIVQNVGCRISRATPTGLLRSVHLRTRKGQTFPFTWTPLVPARVQTGDEAVNSPVMHLLKSGERPFFWFVGTVATQWTIDCSISGTLLQP
jgi:hypothetical protein